MLNNKPNYYNNLDKTYFKIWDLLNIGLLDRNDPFHIPVFTSGINGICDSRVVVLRGLNKKNKTLWFHSDIRSNKIEILKENTNVSLLFYNKNEKIQLRIIGNAKINHQNQVTERAWEKTAHMSRQCYLGKKSPGSKSDVPTSGLTNDIDNSKYTIEESEVGYKNFCLIETSIKSIEWLYLASKGHRRAIFFLNTDTVDKKWLIP